MAAEQEDLLKTYLGSSSLIQAEHQAIRDQVQSLVEKLENDQEKLKAIHAFVSQHMMNEIIPKAMASALDAFQSQEGIVQNTLVYSLRWPGRQGFQPVWQLGWWLFLECLSEGLVSYVERILFERTVGFC